ncbi:hypothetical protein [Hymenobacter cellulosivorans]|uniref:T9SS type A sorting domain-containing protein n=1 Tax=Hymenobacter cellulosivorans TaxID=2932249 RepID=A0ABY4F8B6_9BACT|nr:hypothetical protein [Hymenobacter cellulosivorans]UOQ52896.1 hypothetical protein MUN80_24530 [Hymenobacter cellulosivorans]
MRFSTVPSIFLASLAALSLAPQAVQAQVAPAWSSVVRAVAPSASPSLGSQGAKVVVAPDGSQIVSGYFRGDFTLGGVTLVGSAVANAVNVFVAKFNPDGSVAWVRQGTSNSSQANQRAYTSVDAAGNVYLSGSFSNQLQFGTTTLTAPADVTDAYLVKYDPQGTLLWIRRGGMQTGSVLMEVNTGTDAAGNVYLSGGFSGGSLNFGSTTVVRAFASSAYLAKFDAAGTLQWLRQDGGNDSGGANGRGISVDAAGNAFVTGTQRGISTFGTFTLNSGATPNDNLYLVKYSPQGTPLWARSAGGAGAESGADVALDAAGNIAVVGISQQQASSMYLLRFDVQGTLLWERFVEPVGPTFLMGSGVAFDNRGGLYVTGTFQSSIRFGTTTLTAPSGAYNLFLVRYDQQASVAWAGSVTGPTFNDGGSGSDVATDAAGNVFLTGAVGGNVTFGPISSPNTGTNVFLARLTAGSILSRTAAARTSLALYPNPATGTTTLTLPVGGGHLVLSDALGRPVREQVLPAVAGTCPVALDGLAPGVYQLRATLGNGTMATAPLLVR